MSQLLSIIESGMPESHHQLPPNLQEYFQFQAHLSTIDGVITYKDRIVIPPCLQDTILSALHSAHSGVSFMLARAESSVFWPGITPVIHATWQKCSHCNRMAPSQPSASPTPPVPSAYPFQCVCCDFFSHKGSTYLIYVDRYSNWPVVERSQDGAKGLVNSLWRAVVTYGIPEELASDGRPEFQSNTLQGFLCTWGVHHRLSSVAFPHSNCRAKIGVKIMKWIFPNNAGPSGELDMDAVQRAILQYRNTPDPATRLSPAMIVFGRPIRDFIPILPGRYQPHTTWEETLTAHEEALRNRHMHAHEQWSEHTKRLPPLQVGDHVRIQNQTGNFPKRWDKTGTVIEVHQFDQYVIKVDGSGWLTLQNCKFLHKYLPVITPAKPRSILDDLRPPIPPQIIENPPSQHPLSLTDTPPSPVATTPPSPNETHPVPDNSPPLLAQPLSPISPPTDHTPQGSAPSQPTIGLRMLTRLLPYNNPGLKESNTMSDTFPLRCSIRQQYRWTLNYYQSFSLYGLILHSFAE